MSEHYRPPGYKPHANQDDHISIAPAAEVDRVAKLEERVAALEKLLAAKTKKAKK